MLRLLRSIRRSLMSESTADAAPRLRSYLLYALGEITLVVIGILIALQIGEWNERRAQVERVEEILRQIQSDLIVDVRRLNSLVDAGEVRDSLVRRILAREVTREDYEAAFPVDQSGLFWIGLQALDFEVRRTGWTRLVDLEGEFPSEFEEIRSLLATHYLQNGAFLTESLAGRAQETERRHVVLSDERSWYDLLRVGGPAPEAMIDWYLESERYRNWVSILAQEDQLRPSGMGDYYRIGSLAAWASIARALGDPADHPLLPDDLLIDDPEALEPWLGDWEGGPAARRFSLRLQVTGGVLQMQAEGGRLAVPMKAAGGGRWVYAVEGNDAGLLLDRDGDGAPRLRLRAADGTLGPPLRRPAN